MKTPTPETASQHKSNAFIHTLTEINAGQSIDDLSQELARVIEAVKETNKPGSLTYKLNLKPDGAGKILKLLVEDEISSRVPKIGREKTYFFATDQNTLSRRDPRQMDLGLKIVEKEEAPIKEVAETKTVKTVSA